MAQLDPCEILSSLDVPALVFVGDEDGVVVPDIGRAAAAMLSNARLVEFEDCGHAPFLERSDAYRRDLATFLRGL